MQSRGYIFAPSAAYDQLSAGIDLSQWSFYIDANQAAGPTRLANEAPGLLLSGSEELPIILLLGQDATTESWPNRGSIGGSLTAVNIRPEDIQKSSPFTDGTKSVRFESPTGGTRRYYIAQDASWGDVGLEDWAFEAVYSRELPVGATSSNDCYLWEKRNSGATPLGYSCGAAATTTINPYVRNAAGPFNIGLSTGTTSWTHVSGFFDQTDTTAEGFRTFLGSNSSATTTHTAGTITSTALFRVGDNIAAADNVYFRLAYLAIWRKSDWLAAGATKSAEMLTAIRKRQTYLSGIVESVSGQAPTLYTAVQYRSTRTWNGSEWEHHLLGPGMMAPDQYKLPSTQEMVTAVRIESAFTGHATAENFTTGWTHANNSATVLGSQDLPTSNRRGFTASGVSVVGTAGTGPKTATILWTSALAANTRVFISVWVRAGAAPCFYTRFSDTAGGSDRYAHVRMSDGYVSLGNNANNYATTTEYVNGWWLTEFSSTNTVLSSTNLIFGWSDDIDTFDLTSDGYAVDGYMWGWNGATATFTGYPQQPFPYFGAASTQNLGPILVWPATSLTASAPYSLWWEYMSEWSVNGFGAAAWPMQVSSVDGNNAAYFSTTATVGSSVVSHTGLVAAATQWGQTSATQTGDNTAGSGKRVRWLGSAATNDVKFFNTDGASISPDGTATIPTAMANLRWGSNAAGTIAGRGIQYTRIGVKNVASTDSKGPPGSGIPE